MSDSSAEYTFQGENLDADPLNSNLNMRLNDIDKRDDNNMPILANQIEESIFEGFSDEQKSELLEKFLSVVNKLKLKLNSLVVFSRSNKMTRNLLLSKVTFLDELIKYSTNYSYKFYNDTRLNISNVIVSVNAFCYKVKTQDSVKLLPLRDPITKDLFNNLFLNAGASCKTKIADQSIKLKLIYTVLYYTGLRVNEIAFLTKNSFQLMIDEGSISIIHEKTKTKKIHLIIPEGRKKLKQLENEINYFFETNIHLFSSGRRKKQTVNADDHGIHLSRNVIELVNKDIQHIAKQYGYKGTYSTHSFRVGFITRLLRDSNVQDVAEIIGHKNLMSTMAYNRYEIDREKKEKLIIQSFIAK
jgi:integrase